MSFEALAKYIKAFGKLHRNANAAHGAAPHKPILLLALLGEIERGAYTANLVTVTPELVASFQTHWKALVQSEHWQPSMNLPFRYMQTEGFWHFIHSGNRAVLDAPSYTLNQLATLFDGVQLSSDLWQLLRDPTAIAALRTHLLQTYFGAPDFMPAQKQTTENFLYAEAEKLKAEAQGKFKTIVRERKEDSYYLRHALFPKVVRELYDESCAVCRLNARMEEGSRIVDAAHIVPFAHSHNDDPRNGLALCKNHHWGFDAGAFAIADDYRIIVSNKLQNSQGYLSAGSELHLPDAPRYHPSPDALRWHRENIFQP